MVFADFFVMNLILWGEGSSAAMPFGTLVAILALWFCISVPLTFIGAYFGFKKSVSFLYYQIVLQKPFLKLLVSKNQIIPVILSVILSICV